MATSSSPAPARSPTSCATSEDKLGFKRVRGDTFGYLQRSFAGCVCEVDQREAREVGEKAVQYASWRGRRLGRDPPHRDYAVDYPLIRWRRSPARRGRWRTISSTQPAMT